MPESFLLGVAAGVALAAALVGATALAARSPTVSRAALAAFRRPVRVVFGLAFLCASALLADLRGPQVVQRASGLGGDALGAAGLAVAFLAALAYGVVALVAAAAGRRRLDVALDGSVARYAGLLGYVNTAFPWTPFALYAAAFLSLPASMLALPAVLPAGDLWVAGATGVGLYALTLAFATTYDNVVPDDPRDRVADAAE